MCLRDVAVLLLTLHGATSHSKQGYTETFVTTDPGARLTKYLTIYHKITLSLSQDRHTIVTQKRAKISLRNIVRCYDFASGSYLKMSRILRKMFCKLEFRRKSILALALS